MVVLRIINDVEVSVVDGPAIQLRQGDNKITLSGQLELDDLGNACQYVARFGPIQTLRSAQRIMPDKPPGAK